MQHVSRVSKIFNANEPIIVGLEGLSNTLEQLWISYNNIDKLKNIGNLRKLRVLYMSNNKVSLPKE